MKRLMPLVLAGALLTTVAPTSITHAARPAGGPTVGVAGSITVLVGQGDPSVSPGSALIFTPKYVNVTAGDTVVFRDVDALEPHTVSFGPMAQLSNISNNPFHPLPQKAGPPLIVLNPQIFAPVGGHVVTGGSLVSSGLMQSGQSWSASFPTPGTYKYICLIHGTMMAGVVNVRPQQQGHSFTVLAGDDPMSFNDRSNLTTNDSFYPRHLTIHVGDSVQWIGGFHTVTFGPDALRKQLERTLFMPAQTSTGPQMVFNPRAVYPSGGSTYDGTGFVNSGLLFLRVPQGSKAPPTYRLTFTRPGTYEYDCLIHPGMDGTITVAPR